MRKLILLAAAVCIYFNMHASGVNPQFQAIFQIRPQWGRDAYTQEYMTWDYKYKRVVEAVLMRINPWKSIPGIQTLVGFQDVTNGVRYTINGPFFGTDEYGVICSSVKKSDTDPSQYDVDVRAFTDVGCLCAKHPVDSRSENIHVQLNPQYEKK